MRSQKWTEGRQSGFDLRKENQDNGQTVECAVRKYRGGQRSRPAVDFREPETEQNEGRSDLQIHVHGGKDYCRQQRRGPEPAVEFQIFEKNIPETQFFTDGSQQDRSGDQNGDLTRRTVP